MSSRRRSGRGILSVVGPHSGCGKTLFVLSLLRHVGGLGCLKISPKRDWPAVLENVPGTVETDFVLEDSARLERPGKDTARYLEAGALEVQRLRHRAAGLAAGLEEAWQRFPAMMPVLVESSSAVPLLEPVAVVLVVRPPLREMKPATEAILERVTDLLVNASDREGSATGAAESLAREFPVLRPQFTWAADLISEPPPEGLMERMRVLLTTATRDQSRTTGRRTRP